MSRSIVYDSVRTAASPAHPWDDSEKCSSGDRPVRVLLVNPEEIIADGLRGMMVKDNRVELVGCVPPTEEAFSAAARLHPDVVLFDIRARAAEGLKFAAQMVGRCPPVVIFSNDADDRYLFEALRFGLSGYLLKSLSGAELADHLVRARRGEVVVDPTMAAKVAMRVVRLEDGQRWPGSEIGLSRRESEVLSRLGDGLSNREIAASLTVGEETVKTHLRSIYRKMGVNDRAQAIGSALRKGILA